MCVCVSCGMLDCVGLYQHTLSHLCSQSIFFLLSTTLLVVTGGTPQDRSISKSYGYGMLWLLWVKIGYHQDYPLVI